MDSSSKYRLRVTAGPEYDTHIAVSVNSTQPIVITTDIATITLSVHVKDYHGVPPPAAPTPPYGSSLTRGRFVASLPAAPRAATSAYFTTAARTTARYGLRFAVRPRRALGADTLLLGNDFDAPIRALLPPGFGAALHLVKTLVDPGLEGDPYADRPYLYGPLVSSANVMRVGAMAGSEGGEGSEGGARWGGASMELDLREGADGEEAERLRRKVGVPDEASARMKWFLDVENRRRFTLEAGRTYEFDFFNGYLDFNGEARRLGH
jgi:hypothetical protein